MVRVGINGFGRIGRCTLRAGIEDPDFQVVAINDLVPAPDLAYLLKYDSVHGRFNAKVFATEEAIMVNDQKVTVFSEKDPAAIPWKEVGVDVVIEATGLFTHAKDARRHLEGGAKKVIISAPATQEDITIVVGVNDGLYDREKHHIISNGSCTTNCLAPVVKVIDDVFGVEMGIVTTVHSYTQGQSILDAPSKDRRRGRAAALSIIPASTGAAKAISLVLPHLKGKLNGMAMRVPTPNVSVVDFVATVREKVTVESANQALKEAALGSLKAVLQYEEEALVSQDFVGNPYSSIVDATSTMVLGEKMVKVVSWYDNEWGFSCRLLDLSKLVVG